MKKIFVLLLILLFMCSCNKKSVDGNKTIGEIARQSGCEILDVKNRIKMVLRKEVPTVNVKKYFEYKKLGYTEEKILKIHF